MEWVRFMHGRTSTMAHAMIATGPTQTARRPVRALPARERPIQHGTRIGGWRVDDELGRGGMASVHAVVHSKFGKRAAIKIAHHALVDGKLTPATFHREARIVHAIEHPGVIDVFATGSFHGRPYLVMEKLVGSSLGKRVDTGPIPHDEAIEILLELCDILRAAHAAGVIHRDLKLDNVFLVDQPYSGYRRVKLLDWGVAHLTSEQDPFRGVIAGTLTYVAPEQIRGDALTPAADVYALAVLAHHLLCSRPPFSARSELALCHMHLRETPPRASVAWPGIPRALDDLLARMLAKQPEQRPSLDEIENVLRDAALAIAGPPPASLALPAPPFHGAWIGAAVGLIGLGWLVQMLVS